MTNGTGCGAATGWGWPRLCCSSTALSSATPCSRYRRGGLGRAAGLETTVGLAALLCVWPWPCPWFHAPQVAHPLVQKQLVEYIHNGFLVPVMGPALHKVSPTCPTAPWTLPHRLCLTAPAPHLLLLCVGPAPAP